MRREYAVCSWCEEVIVRFPDGAWSHARADDWEHEPEPDPETQRGYAEPLAPAREGVHTVRPAAPIDWARQIEEVRPTGDVL